jgi:homoserine kinase
MRRVKVRVPATTANLGPGFDTLGLALDLYNTVEVEPIASGIEVRVAGAGAGQLAEDESNLVYRCVRAAGERAGAYRRGKPPCGIRLRCVNRIPVARGLGSSAAAIAGGLVAGARCFGARLTAGDLLEMAMAFEPNPDNLAAALLGGLTAASLDGDRLAVVRLPPPQGLRVAAVIPDRPVLTAEARRVLPKRVPFRDAVANVTNTAVLVAAMAAGDVETARRVMIDRLHQPYRERVVPGLRAALREAERREIPGVALSGSGSTIAAFGGREVGRVGWLLQRALARAGIQSVVKILRPSRTGAYEDFRFKI